MVAEDAALTLPAPLPTSGPCSDCRSSSDCGDASLEEPAPSASDLSTAVQEASSCSGEEDPAHGGSDTSIAHEALNGSEEESNSDLSAAIERASRRNREQDLTVLLRENENLASIVGDGTMQGQVQKEVEEKQTEGDVKEPCDPDGIGNAGARVKLDLPFGSSHRRIGEAVEILLAREPRCIPSKAPIVLFTHRSPRKPVHFGRWFGKERAPVVLLQCASDSLADYMRNDPEGPFADLRKEPPVFPIAKGSIWKQWAFDEDNKEQLLKADWHAVPHLEKRSGLFVPRLAKWGNCMRAPPRIVAFMMAFRAVNRPVWSAITEALTGLRQVREEESEAYREERRGKLLGTFIECFKNGRHFGIVEAQVGNVKKPWRQPSHKDGATSLLHLGITLGGRRTLRAGLFPSCTSEGNAARATDAEFQDPNAMAGENNVWDEDLWSQSYLKEEDMKLGSIYLSSPFCFEHAVEYQGCQKASEPMIALMCRWGLPEDLGRHINEMRSEDMLDVTTVIASCLKTACSQGQLRMPSLDEVKQGEARLARLDKEEEERLKKIREERAERRKHMRPMQFAG